MSISPPVRRTKLGVRAVGVRQLHQVNHLRPDPQPRPAVRQFILRTLGVNFQSEQSAVERHGALEVVANHRDVMDALYLDFFSERLCARRAHRARARRARGRVGDVPKVTDDALRRCERVRDGHDDARAREEAGSVDAGAGEARESRRRVSMELIARCSRARVDARVYEPPRSRYRRRSF